MSATATGEGPGTLLIVSAPSGAGKTSLVQALCESLERIQVSVSYTTRAPRPGEEDGVHYHFVDQARFDAMVAAGEFLEYATVFGNSYGTSRQHVFALLDQGIDVVLEIDWQGARQIQGQVPQCVGVFILPPSRATLWERLRGRGQDGEEVIRARMADARQEISHYGEYDFLVVNDDFDRALYDLRSIAEAQRLARRSQVQRLRALLADLLGGPGPGRKSTA